MFVLKCINRHYKYVPSVKLDYLISSAISLLITVDVVWSELRYFALVDGLKEPLAAALGRCSSIIEIACLYAA